MIHETDGVPDIKIHDATTIHAQAIGVLEKTQSTKKASLETSSDEFREKLLEG